MSTTLKDASRVEVSGEVNGNLVGRTIGKYRVLKVVGKGGMGCVYEAVNTTIHKHVAMKFIDRELARNEEATARFQREALAASAIESPHIVQIFDAGETDDHLPYIVMELLRGVDLGHYIGEHGTLPVDESLLFVAYLLKGLHHAHSAGIVHRDLKPDNVFLVQLEDEPLFVKLLDFGVSKITRTATDVPLQTLTRQGSVVGTPFYMSPEQAQAYPDVDGRTDIYSAGAILYECLTGRPPHIGKSYEQVIVHICMHDADDVRKYSPDTPEAVAQIVAKALSRERDDRYQDAKAMLAALVEQLPESARVSSTSSLLKGISLGTSGAGAEARAQTPRVISTPTGQAANELADTVMKGADDETLAQSGSRVTGADRTLATKRSPDARSASRMRWTLGAVALLAVATSIYLGVGGGGETATTASAASAEGRPVETATETVSDTAPAAEPAPTASIEPPAAGSASAHTTAAVAKTAPAVTVPRPPVIAVKPTATKTATTPPPPATATGKTGNTELQLQTE